MPIKITLKGEADQPLSQYKIVLPDPYGPLKEKLTHLWWAIVFTVAGFIAGLQF
jgi:hypothetical protein